MESAFRYAGLAGAAALGAAALYSLPILTVSGAAFVVALAFAAALVSFPKWGD
jgi:hypothetical protein